MQQLSVQCGKKRNQITVDAVITKDGIAEGFKNYTTEYAIKSMFINTHHAERMELTKT
jgi:hypothetical protein